MARIIQAHGEVLEGLFAFVKGERDLSVGYVKELHAPLLRHQDSTVVFDQFEQSFETALHKGQYKTLPNNPRRPDGATHEYCPPEHVSSEMDRLMLLHREHSSKKIASHIDAAWAHHSLTQIHPCQDGNGRVARAVATLVLIKAGMFPLVVNRDDRERYIGVLELADGGDLSPLVQFFARLQKRSLTKAIGWASVATPAATLDEALNSTRDMLVNLGRIIPAEFLKAKQTAGVLANIAVSRLNIVVTRLMNDIGQVDSSFKFGVGDLGKGHIDEIRVIGERMRYDPNTTDYHRGHVLKLTVGAVGSTITVCFHGVGAAFRGLLVAVCYFRQGTADPVALSEDIFRISYQENPDDVARRFAAWVDRCLIEGLAQWRRTLL